MPHFAPTCGNFDPQNMQTPGGVPLSEDIGTQIFAGVQQEVILSQKCDNLPHSCMHGMGGVPLLSRGVPPLCWVKKRTFCHILAKNWTPMRILRGWGGHSQGLGPPLSERPNKGKNCHFLARKMTILPFLMSPGPRKSHFQWEMGFPPPLGP